METPEFSAVTCCVCGIRFGLPAARYHYLRDHGGDFWCPNSHILHFNDTTVAKLNRKIANLELDLNQTRNVLGDQRRLVREVQAKAKVKIEKLRRRVNAGTCPHCHRSFVALARHIKTKHPEEPLPND